MLMKLTENTFKAADGLEHTPSFMTDQKVDFFFLCNKSNKHMFGHTYNKAIMVLHCILYIYIKVP